MMDSMKYHELVLACMFGAVMGGAPAAHAQLAITNGNFETGAGNNIDNVSDWNDTSDGTFWHGTWQTNAAAITPNGTTVVVLGSYEAGAVQNTASADADTGNHLYQSIGTADGLTSVDVQFDWGAPNDDPGGRELGLTIGVYAYDGVGAFTPDDTADVRGADGVTFLGSQSFTMTTTGVDGLVESVTATLDLSAAGTQELFLRFNTFRPAATESWPVLDNVVLIPDSPVPVFVTQPEDFFGFVGDTVTLTSSAAAEPAPTYQWQYSADGEDPWIDLGGETNASLVIDPAATADNGFYRVIASNENGDATSDEVLVDLIFPNPTITQQPASTGAFAGSTVELTVIATGVGNLSYQWFKVGEGGDIELSDGGNITGATTATLELGGIGAAEAGGYYVIVSDDAAVAEEGFPRETFSEVATVRLVDLTVTAGLTAPATDSFDEFYLPGNVDDVDNIDGSPGGIPIVTSGDNDESTYVAFDKTSQGMSFTTGSDPLGYTIASVTVRHVQWDNYLGNGTYYDLQNGDLLKFQFGTVTGGVKTPVFHSDAALYTGDALVNAAQPDNLGSGTYLTFDLSAAEIGTLDPDTTYYFEISTTAGDPYFELSGTSLDGYAGGTAFRGEAVAEIDGSYVELAGDRAFHVDLTGLSGPADDYATWISNYPGVGGATGFNDDPDGDGLANGVENFFGTDPGATNSGVTGIAKSGGTVTFLHPQNEEVAGDVSAAYRWSTDLVTWHASGETAAGTTVTFVATGDMPASGTTTVTATVTGPVPARLFTRIEVSQTEP